MRRKLKTLALLLPGVLLLTMQAVNAQSSSPPPATATRPADNMPGQTSVPNDSPPATRTQTTGQTNPDPTVKEMNEDAKRKTEREGK
ncbi:MAG: hypothetical protein E6G85_02510 [Alphaproteobacteria bacterium]|nr:MAG: hypothetical protein E6G85_02510 [Alphaproteobacteria bacterium]